MKEPHTENSISLQDQAYEEIQRRILLGIYAPGEKLVIKDISDSLNIGRTPVLAAVNRLTAQGLVEAIPNRGVSVARITPRRLMELTDARLMMETFCAKYIAVNAKRFPHLLSEMQETVNAIKQVQSLDEAYDLETRFHTLYIQLAGNQTILNFYKSIWNVGGLFYIWRMMGTSLDDLHTTLEESEEILRLCQSGDAAALENCVRSHLQHVYDYIEQYIRFGNPG